MQGCPLASVWTVGSDYPNNNVKGDLSGTDVTFSAPSSCDAATFDKIAQGILKDYKDGVADAPGNNRLLFHSAGTYTAVGGPTSLGGVNGGWIRFKANRDFPENAGLGPILDYVQEIVDKYPCITFADASIFAGVVLTEAAGGPAVAWMPGRRDADKTPQNPIIATRLPDGTFTSSAVVYYYTQLGLNDREMAVLNGGGHSFGGAAPENSGWNGSFTPQQGFPTPKNLYFIQSFEEEWVPQITRADDDKTLRVQYVLVDGNGDPALSQSGAYVIRIPSDVALLLDGREATAWSYAYAKDSDLFMSDYARVLQRISQTGAGGGWQANKTQYEWLGINGTATNYGTNIEPPTGEPPVPVSDIAIPQWLQNIKDGNLPLFFEAQGMASPSPSPGASPAASGASGNSLMGMMVVAVAVQLVFLAI